MRVSSLGYEEAASMTSGWKKEYLDAVLVPAGILVLVAYHAKLAYRVTKFPSTTVIGINQLSLQAWVQYASKDGVKHGIFVVQTLRNSILSSSLLATASIILSCMTGLLLNRYYKASNGQARLTLGEITVLAPPIKLESLLACFLLASLCYVRSLSYHSNASLLGMPFCEALPALSAEHFSRSMVRAAQFRVMGTRAFFLSVPLLLWLYGPIQMFCCSILATIVLHFEDKPKLKSNKSQQSPEQDLEEGSTVLLGSLPADSICNFCAHE